MITRIIGDVHGLYRQYLNLIEHSDSSIQLGDMGVGFDAEKDHTLMYEFDEKPSHKFIHGNHDAPRICQDDFPNFLGRKGYIESQSLVYISGAWSIDYFHRREKETWWFNEELSQNEFDEIEEIVYKNKPQVIISHDAPHTVPIAMGLHNPEFGGPVITRTGYRLEKIFRLHQPKYWFFGHWHKTKTQKINGTTFQCLGELDWVDFDFDKMERVL
jgi:predicted phosphodiesterase